MKQDLKLSEKLFCLSINPSKGGSWIGASSVLKLTLIGTILMELINKEIISVENKKIHLVNPSFQNDDVYEFFLNPIKLHGKDRRISRWISFFKLRARKIRKLIKRDLLRKNIIRIEEKRFLFIPYDKVFLMDRPLIENIRMELENTLLGKIEASEELIILSMMVAKTNLLRHILPDRTQRKIGANFIKKLPETQVSKAVQDAIHMMHATVVVAST